MKPYRINEISKKYVDYDMIRMHTDLPAFPDSRLRLLYSLLNQNHSTAQQSELYTLVIALVQLAIDTHERIDTETVRISETEMRSRQLKILAGDYFSANYYRLLSQAGQIEMISKISVAVSEVNRLKMNFYIKMNQLKVTADEYLSQIVQLKSELLEAFSSVLEGHLSRIWPEVLRGLCRCEAVLEEMNRTESTDQFPRSWAYWHVMQEGTEEEQHQLQHNPQESVLVNAMLEKYKVRHLLASKLKQAVEGVRSIASRLQSDEIAEVLQHITEAFLVKMARPAPAL
ncbi:MAG: heptaprenyl diphosphate synthase component 1 [Candidatus Pristimantibacillus sp.]